MTIEKEIKDFLKYYSNKVPNPIHEPIRFAYFILTYKFYKERSKNEVG